MYQLWLWIIVLAICCFGKGSLHADTLPPGYFPKPPPAKEQSPEQRVQKPPAASCGSGAALSICAATLILLIRRGSRTELAPEMKPA
jgi:hypothetical protein